jgi:hypothetical protein
MTFLKRDEPGGVAGPVREEVLSMSKRFEYGTATIKDLVVRTSPKKEDRGKVLDVTIKGQPLKPSQRFWTSLQVRFGFSDNIFKFFRHDEVFQRISQVASNDKIRYCIERDEGGAGTLLAVTNPTSALIHHDDLLGLLRKYRAENVSYNRGFVRSTHSPKFGGKFQIAGDDFQNKFIIDTPIDGFGRPSVYLSLLRLLCANGAIGYSRAFRSELSIGKASDAAHFALVRVLEGFNNEEGFAALRQRFEAAATSWASVNEANRLYKSLIRLHHNKEVQGNSPMPARGGDGATEFERSLPVIQAFHKMTGDLTQIYGLANLDALSVKRQRTLPTPCKVYDLLNFTSEVATHHATPGGARSLQAMLGDLISNEYDLEGTGEQVTSWRDFFVTNKDTTSTMASLNSRSGR